MSPRMEKVLAWTDFHQSKGEDVHTGLERSKWEPEPVACLHNQVEEQTSDRRAVNDGLELNDSLNQGRSCWLLAGSRHFTGYSLRIHKLFVKYLWSMFSSILRQAAKRLGHQTDPCLAHDQIKYVGHAVTECHPHTLSLS